MDLPIDPPSNHFQYSNPDTWSIDNVNMDVNPYPTFQPYQPKPFNNGLSLLFGALQSLFSLGSAFANRAYQEKQQAAEQFYSSPKEQMRRFKEAGINPYLALGNVSSGSFGNSPNPLPDFGGVFGQSINSGLQMVSSLSDIQTKVLQNDMMLERINQLRLSNYYNSLSVGDRLKLITANLSSVNKVNMLKDFDIQFQRWYNDPTLGKFIQYIYNPETKNYIPYTINYDGMSPAELNASMGLVRGDLTNNKILSDYYNSIDRGDLLSAQITGALLGNDRDRIARDFERRTGLPWNQANANPLDKLMNILFNKLVEKYGDTILSWFKNL